MRIPSRLTRRDGQGSPEYGLIVAGVVVLAVSVFLALGTPINDLWTDTGEYIEQNSLVDGA